jgi:predicted nuclease of predicted toxin-antitoxin system
MKFLIDAQLPRSLKRLFISKGYDCIHTLDLVRFESQCIYLFTVIYLLICIVIK